MNRFAILLTTVLTAAALTPLHAAEVKTESAKTFSAAAARYLGHVDYLASDALKGRGFASPDIDKAADYIAEQWKSSGVEPAGDDETWFQAFEITARKQLDADDASLSLPGVSHPLKLGSDWTPLPFSAIGDAEGPIAFAGYGIEAPEFDYDDFLDIDPAGKILLIFRYEPRSKDSDADFGGDESSQYSFFREKAATAAKYGAKGIIVVNPPSHPNTVEDQLISFDPWATRPTYDLPMIQISREVASEVVHALGLPDLATLQEKLDSDRLSLSAEFPDKQVAMKTGVRPARGKNVVGIFRGDGTTDETIVVGAHYDHLGVSPARGEDEPQIHNGADDNASGTAGLIELAHRLSKEKHLRRNVLFIAFSAEELGLWGSRHFVEKPTVPLDSLKAMINFDMIGRYRDGEFEISGSQSANGLKQIVDDALQKEGIKAKLPTRFRPDSDHAPFFRAGIPHLFFHTGLHEDYHRPGDDTNLVNAEGAVEVLDVGYTIIHQLANMTEGPTATKDEDDGNDNSSSPRVSNRSRVRLGILPNMEDEGPGMLVTRVIEGSSAGKAGMVDNDRIIKIGETEISSLLEYRAAMEDYDYGESAEIVIRRDGKDMTLKVEFERPRRTRNAPS